MPSITDRVIGHKECKDCDKGTSVKATMEKTYKDNEHLLKGLAWSALCITICRAGAHYMQNYL